VSSTASVSFTPSIVRLPRFELELSTMPDRFVVHLGCSRCRPCCGSCRSHSPCRRGHSACAFCRRLTLCALQSVSERCTRAGLAASWATRAGRQSAPGRPREPGQAFQCCGWAAAGRACTVYVGRARFRPRSRLKLKIPFLFFIRVLTKFKLQKCVSKYPKLQNF
jgi:hypothetical protein